MEKIKSRDEVASRLKQKEDDINRHFEALQGEVKQTKKEVEAYVKANPWIGIVGSIVAGIGVGLIIGKKSQKAIHKELVNTYVNRLAEVTRHSGASEAEVGSVLRDALKDTLPQVVYSMPEKNSSKGLGGKLVGMMASIAFSYFSKALIHRLEQQFDSSSTDSALQKGEEGSI